MIDSLGKVLRDGFKIRKPDKSVFTYIFADHCQCCVILLLTQEGMMNIEHFFLQFAFNITCIE